MKNKLTVLLGFLWLTAHPVAKALPVTDPADDPDPDPGMLCSVKSAKPQPVTLPIVNTSGKTINVYWRDSMCIEHKYAKVDIGKMLRQPTYMGQVWVLRNSANGSLIKETKVEGLACSVNNGSAQRTYAVKNTTKDKLRLFLRDTKCHEVLKATLAPGQSVQQTTTMGQSWVLRNSANFPFKHWVTVPGSGSPEPNVPPISIAPTSNGQVSLFTDHDSQHVTPTVGAPPSTVGSNLTAISELADGSSVAVVIAEVNDALQSTAVVVGPDNITSVTADVAPTADEGVAVVSTTVTVNGNLISQAFDVVNISLPSLPTPPGIPDDDVVTLDAPPAPAPETSVPDAPDDGSSASSNSDSSGSTDSAGGDGSTGDSGTTGDSGSSDGGGAGGDGGAGD